jgi:hypothetical protein
VEHCIVRCVLKGIATKQDSLIKPLFLDEDIDETDAVRRGIVPCCLAEALA